MTTAPIAGYRRSVLARSLAFALTIPFACGAAFAQEASDEEEEDSADTTQLDTVEVVGSRIKRAEIEGPSPVTVITAAQIEAEGFNTVYDALNTLTQTTGSIQNELTQSGFTPNAQVLNLRGLGPGRVLTLINGRRAADYPLPYNGQSNFVNLSSVPAAAVERIELLAGGASAIYGSDAVAGVVNIVLKSNFEGQYLSYLTGRPTRGGAPTNNIQWVGGNTGDRWSLTYAVEYYDRGEMFASERDFMDSYRDDPSVDPATATAVQGIRLRDRLAGPGAIGTGPQSQVWQNGETLESTCARWGGDFEIDTRTGSANPANDGSWCGYYGYPATQAIRNSDENISGYIYGTLDITDNTQAFMSLNVWDSEASAASNTQFWSVPLYYDPNYGSIMDGQRIFTPNETGGVGGQRTIFNERAIDFAAGLRGSFADSRYTWDLVLSHSQYETSNDRPRFLAQELTNFFLGPRLGTVSGYPVYELNQDRYFNPITAAEFNAMSTIVKTEADSSATNAQFVVTGDLFEMPAGPLSFAAVVEMGSQEYDLNPDPRILPGQNIIYNLTGTGGGGERDRYAFGTEFSIPLHDTFKATLAARYDVYDDITAVDNAFTWNAGLEWRPTDSLLFRGAYSTSFRAPDMHFVFAETSGFFQTSFDEFACRNAGLTVTQCGNSGVYNYSVFGTREGNPDLEEETGRSYTVGMVWDIVDNLALTVDYYNIELEGGVRDLSRSYILQNEADCRLGQDRQGNAVDGGSAFCQYITGFVTRTVGGPNDGRLEQIDSIPINGSFISNEGIDASIRYTLDTDRMGNFGFQLGWSHVLDQKFAEFEGQPRDSYRDDLTNFDFRSRMRGSVSWQYKDLDVTVFGTRYGSLPNWAETGRIAPYHVYNLNVGYEFTENFRASLIVNNVLDKIAPKDDTFFTYPFFWRAFSPIGREVFVQAEFNW
ncbi:TonB-dependent receptor plug domain-containing protein [Arenimonas sp.]|uniref:TonB-dependent receptor plug domain-containing protein n=1 Tax=Arenimonas sp. TaxID=1872635 RepID=UPI0035B48A3E